MDIKAFLKIRIFVFIPIILSLSLLIINPIGVREISRRAIIPLRLIGAKIKGFNPPMGNNITLEEENERLKRENAFLLHRYAKIDEVFLENQRLRNLLAFKEKTQFNVIVANTLSFSSSFFSPTIIIDRGSNDGIKRGFSVVSHFKGKEVFVGRVFRVFPTSSIVLLTTDPGFLIPGRLKNSREKGLLTGQMDKMEFKFIERQTHVFLGEPVITIGDAITPDGILIGYVKEIKEGLGLFKNVFTKPAMPFSSLEEVLVLVP